MKNKESKLDERNKEMLEHSYKTMMRVLEAGQSQILENWQKHSTITKDEFADAIAWVCEDRRNYAALTSTGWKKIQRKKEGQLEVFRTLDGMIWEGEEFDMELTPEQLAVWGPWKTTQKIAISSMDKI